MICYPEKMPHQEFKRFCKVLKLREDDELIRKYIEAHRPENTWPEVNQGMKDVGILDMEIYIVDNLLFMIMDTVVDFDHEKAMTTLAGMPRQAEWEAHMARFQDTSEDASAGEKWQPIERIYKLA